MINAAAPSATQDPAAESESVRWIRFEFARHVHAYLQDQIRFSDTKAGVTAAVAGVLFGAFRDATRSSFDTFPPTSVLGALAIVAAAVFSLCSLMTVLNAYLVIRPRMPSTYASAAPHHRMLERATAFLDHETSPSSGGDLVNWAEIGDRVLRPDGPTGYARDVRGMGPVELTAQLSEHSVMLALIAGQKYQHVRFALNSLLLAALSLVLLMVLLRMSPAT
ncbi:MAG TPA: hypothetical protein VF998_05755 [Candidatus Limnocylindria bacterium]